MLKSQLTITRRVLFFAVVLVVFGTGFYAGTKSSIFVSNGKPSIVKRDLDLSEFDEALALIKQEYYGSVDETKAKQGMIKGLTDSLDDPYSSYFTPSDAALFRDELTSQVTGIGAELTIKDRQLTVIAPISGSPAEQAGIKAGDIILGIDHKSSDGLSLTESVLKIRGKSGTDVTLTIKDGSQTKDIKITRAEIKVPSVTSKQLEGKIGYVKISSFATDTGTAFKGALIPFVADGVSKLIIDLRSNPGGYLDQAVEVGSQLIEKGDVVIEQDKNGKQKHHPVTSGGIYTTGATIVVLIDKGTASAAEILAGALKIDHKATVMGEKSFGKGSVQSPFPLKEGAILKLTVGKWLLPDGSTIDHVGIEPDQVVSSEGSTKEDDKVLAAAITYLKK